MLQYNLSQKHICQFLGVSLFCEKDKFHVLSQSINNYYNKVCFKCYYKFFRHRKFNNKVY